MPSMDPGRGRREAFPAAPGLVAVGSRLLNEPFARAEASSRAGDVLTHV